MPIPGNGKDAALLVGVNDAVADKPIIPCVDVEVEPLPAAVAEAVCVIVMTAVFIGGSVVEDLGAGVGPPGRAVSAGTPVPVRVRVGVEMGVQVGTPVAVGVRPEVQSGVSVRVKV